MREQMLMRPDEYRVMFEAENEYWWYRGLRALLRTLLARYAPIDPRGALILDAGCGTGANLEMLQAYGHALGVDISTEAIAFCRARGIPGGRAFVTSLTNLPFRDSVFDLAISYDVICNIPDDAAAFVEIARALKRGGYFIVQLPAYQCLWSPHDVAVGHQRRYSTRDVRERIARADLEIVRILHTNALLLPFVAIRRLWRQRAWPRGRTVASDLQTRLPRAVNAALTLLYGAEVYAAARVDIPFGLSVIAVARKR